MKIDFHIHTTEYSRCAQSSAEDQIKAAIHKGIDVMFITDHMTLYPMDLIEVYNKKYAPFKIYQGIEVTILDECYEDVVVIGVHDPKIQGSHWSYEALYRFVREQGGALILAHPYRFSDEVNLNVWDYPPDAIEILSSNLGKHNLKRRRLLATSLERPTVTNSDSHTTENTGCYYNDFPGTCITEALIIKALIEGDFTHKNAQVD
jgi:histidinol phosphatase-like PHP family hydrolase